MKTLSLNHGTVYLDKKLVKTNLLLKNGKISAINDKPFDSGQILNCDGKWILPGAIDPHVHFRTPGMEHKENWKTGSIAAAAGGVTTVLDMPNTNPATTTRQNLNEKRELAKKDSIVNFGFHFGATHNNVEEVESVTGVASIKIYLGSTTGNLLVTDNKVLKRILDSVKIPLSFHAENEQLINQNKKNYENQDQQPSIHGIIRNEEVAKSAVENILNLAKPYSPKLYFCHVSTKGEVELINSARTDMEVYAEATPHHLFLNEDILQSIGNFGKVNPPIRSEANREFLYDAMIGNMIDTIGTDHAPHLREEKERDYKKSPAGLPGVETYMPILLTEVIEGRLPIERLMHLCSNNPAKIFSIKDKGAIKIDYDADLMIVNPAEKWVIQGEQLKTNVKWTPFEGRQVSAKIETTIVNGQVVFHNGEMIEVLAKEVCYS